MSSNDKLKTLINGWNDTLTTGYLSDIFKEIYNDKFIFNDGILYYYNNVYWQKDNKSNSIISNYIDSIFYKTLLDNLLSYEKETFDLLYNSNGAKDLAKKHHDKMYKQKNELLRLRTITFRKSLVEDIKNKLNNPDVKFNTEPYLFAFNNKIFDLTLGTEIEPNPDYYISLTTGYDYKKIEDAEFDKLDNELNQLLDTIFYEEELKKLYLTILSTGLSAIPLEKFVIANGSGGNGKGVINEFTQHMMGDYAYILPSTILLNPLKTGANPELANLNNKRLVFSREPDSKFKFNCSSIKELVGGSEINARTIYSENTKTNLHMTFIMECNQKPKLNETTDALSRRIIDILFKSKFVDKSMYNKLLDNQKRNVYIINPYYKTLEFKEKYKITLFHLLLKYFKNYYDNNSILPITDEVLQRNQDYLKNSDDMMNWINETYIITDDIHDIVNIKDMYNLYRLSDKYINSTKEQKRDFSYRNFVSTLNENIFLKLYVKKDINKIYIMTNMIKIDDEDEYKVNKINKDNYDDEDDIELSETIKRKQFTKKINDYGLDI